MNVCICIPITYCQYWHGHIFVDQSPIFLQLLIIFVWQLVVSGRKMVFWRLSVFGSRLFMHFGFQGVLAAASKSFCRPNWSEEGFWCSLIGCQPFRDRSRTGVGPIVNVNLIANNICRNINSLALYLWPYRFHVAKRLPSAIRTSLGIINRQPVDNQSANKCRFTISWEFGGFWSPVVVRDRHFFLIAGGRRPVFTSVWL